MFRRLSTTGLRTTGLFQSQRKWRDHLVDSISVPSVHILRQNMSVAVVHGPSQSEPTWQYTLQVLGLMAAGIGAVTAYQCIPSFFDKRMMAQPLSAECLATDMAKGKDRLYYSVDDLEVLGQGEGAKGRSAPTINRLLSNDNIVGYHKYSAEGREGFLNELIYHRLAERVMDGPHPKVKVLYRAVENSSQHEYSLFIQCIGRTLNLEDYLDKAKKDLEHVTDDLVIKHLGTSVAYANLIGSIDAYLKNYVVIESGGDSNTLSSYSIDFELLEQNTNRKWFVDFTQEPEKAANHIIKRGGILNYTSRENAPSISITSKVGSGTTNADDSELNNGDIKYPRILYHLLIRSFVKDINEGRVLQLYRNIAKLNENDVDNIVDPCAPLLQEEEIQAYKMALQEIISQTKHYLERNQLIENSRQWISGMK